MQENVEVFVINAQHIKAVPGRKTDVKVAEWIANLLRHALITPSYIPGREQRELREFIRYRSARCLKDCLLFTGQKRRV